MQIVLLTGNHNRQGFDCGREALNDWLRRVARQHQSKGVSRTFVATLESEPTVICGYFALTVTEVDSRELPEHRRKGLPRLLPGVRLGRLAIARQHQGKGLGKLLLMNAIERTRLIHEQTGVVGLFVDALDESAAGFYAQYGFETFADAPLKLVLPIAG